MPSERIAGIKAPTLIFHSREDRLQLYQNAEYAVEKISHATIVSFDRGGHLIMVTEQPKISDLLQKHILKHSDSE